MNNEVVEYYDSIAADYDRSRFAGSYGRYIDAQERAVLRKFLRGVSGPTVAELACGTGRLLDFASVGVDASHEMLRCARQKHPEARLVEAQAHRLPFDDASVDAIYCFHLLMHLEPDYIAEVLADVERVLRPGGVAIFDIPSRLRRNVARRNQGGWHGNTAFTVDEFLAMAPDRLRYRASRGLLLAPVHALPHGLRRAVRPIDSLLCATPLKHYASYIVVKFEKK